MKKVKYSGARKFLKGRGFAAVLILSITAVGASALIAYNSTIDKLKDDDGQKDKDAQAVENQQDGIPRDDDIDTDSWAVNNHIESQTESALEPNATADNEAEEANNFIKPESPKLLPIDGEIIASFSNGELVKSNTLGVWRTHDAVDIEAALGAEIKAMQKGTVSDVYTNPMWGICVTLDHGDGLSSVYMGLDKDVKVEVGNAVEAGDVIALAGNTAEAEIADPPHLHFAVRRGDVWIDPIAFINE